MHDLYGAIALSTGNKAKVQVRKALVVVERHYSRIASTWTIFSISEDGTGDIGDYTTFGAMRDVLLENGVNPNDVVWLPVEWRVES